MSQSSKSCSILLRHFKFLQWQRENCLIHNGLNSRRACKPKLCYLVTVIVNQKITGLSIPRQYMAIYPTALLHVEQLLQATNYTSFDRINDGTKGLVHCHNTNYMSMPFCSKYQENLR